MKEEEGRKKKKIIIIMCHVVGYIYGMACRQDHGQNKTLDRDDTINLI
jgi:hypothetical protein